MSGGDPGASSPELYFPKPIFVLGRAHPPEPALPQASLPEPRGEQQPYRDGVEHEEEEAPPPPPPGLRVEPPADWKPALVVVDTHSMSLQWGTATATVESTCGYNVEYLLNYELEMQMADGDSSVQTPFEIKEHKWSKQYSGTANYIQVTGLRPGMRYAVRVTCKPVVLDPLVVIHLSPPSEVTVVCTPATPPIAPTAPGLSSRLRNTMKFKWDEPEETGGRVILEYLLEMAPQPQGAEDLPPNAEGYWEMYRGPERSFQVKRLLPGVSYTARVKAWNCLGESPFSPPATYTTQATVPATPEPPVVVASSETSATLRWRAPEDNGSEISGYQVERDDGRGGAFQFLYHGLDTTCTASSLMSGLVYRFRLRAENEAGRSQWSVPCEARTSAATPSAPGAPTKLGCSQSSVSLTWAAPDYDGGSPVGLYEVEMQPKCAGAKRGMSTDWMLSYAGGDCACTLGGLRAGCTYRARVRAVNSAGAGPYSAAVDVATAPDVPDAPTALTASSRQQTGLMLSWSTPEHDGGTPLVNYRLEGRALGRVEDSMGGGSSRGKGQVDPPFEAAYLGPECSTEVSGLEPGTRYQFRVLAINKQGASQWSPTVMIETKAGLPFQPDAPEASAPPSGSTLQLSWQQPYGQGAPVNSYVLQVMSRDAAREGSTGNRTPLRSSEARAASRAGLASNGASRGRASLDASSSEDGTAADGTAADGTAAAGTALPLGNGADSISGTMDALFSTVYHGADTTHTVRGLEPDTEYTLRLRAHNSMGASPWSQVVSLRTAPAAPSAPTGLHADADASTASSVALAWQAPLLDHGSSVSGYHAEYCLPPRSSRSGAAAAWKLAYQGPDCSCTVGQLSPGREYHVRVRASNACGWGPWSEVVLAGTNPDAPAAPEPPTFSNRMGSSVRAKWAPPADDHGAAVTAYEAQAAPAGSTAWETVYRGEAVTCKVTGLSPGSAYGVRVRAINAVGAGPFSEAASVETTRAPPGPPSDVETAVVEAGEPHRAAAVSVTWAPPPAGSELQAPCISFEVEAAVAARAADGAVPGKTSSGAAPYAVRQTCGGKSCQHTLSGLQPGTAYSIRVRGIGADGAGHGEWSASASVALPQVERPPPAPQAEADADSSPGEAKGRRRKASARQDSDVAKSQRSNSLGLKSAAAKAPPKKATLLQHLAKATGLSLTQLKASFSALVLVVVVVCFFLASRAPAARKQ